MDNINQLVLIAGIILLAVFSMKVSQDSINAMNQMNHQVQMMFVKS